MYPSYAEWRASCPVLRAQNFGPSFCRGTPRVGALRPEPTPATASASDLADTAYPRTDVLHMNCQFTQHSRGSGTLRQLVADQFVSRWVNENRHHDD